MTLLKNVSIITIGIIISNIFAYFFHIIAGRFLGPSDYGTFGVLFYLLTLLSFPFNSLGTSVTKFSAEYYSKNEYNKIGILKKKLFRIFFFINSLLALIIIFLSGFISDYLRIGSKIGIIFVGLSLIFANLIILDRGLLQGMKKYKLYSFNIIVESISRFIVLIIILFLGFGVNGAILSYGFGYFVAFLFLFPYFKKIETKNESLDISKIYKLAILIFFANLLIQSFINLPIIIIKHYYSGEIVGYWTAALTISKSILLISIGVNLIMFAEVSGENNKNKRKEIFLKSLFLTFLISIGLSFLFFIIPDFFILILYGEKFLGASRILQFLGVAMSILSFIQLYINYKLAII